MEREKSTRKRSSSGRSRASASHAALDDDTKSSASQIKPFSTSSVSDEVTERAVLRVIEFCSDSLIDRFLEYDTVSASLLIRGFEGSELPGHVVASFQTEKASETGEHQILHYSDTNFFHVLHGGESLILCTPHHPGDRFTLSLMEFLEKVFRCEAVKLPLMAANVRTSLLGNMNLRAFLELRTSAASNRAPHSTSSWIPSYINAMTSNPRSSWKHIDDPQRTTSNDVLQTSRARKLVDEFSLLIHQSSPTVVLLQSLDRIRAAIHSSEIPRRCGPQLDSYLSTIAPLLQILWGDISSDVEVRDGVSQLIRNIVASLLSNQTSFLFAKFAPDSLQILFPMLRDTASVLSWSSDVRLSIVSLFAVMNPIQVIKAFRSLAFQSAEETLDIAVSLSHCCLDSLYCQKGRVPTNPHDSRILLHRLRDAISWNSSSYHSRVGTMNAFTESDDTRLIDAEILILGFPVCVELIMVCIDSSVDLLLYCQRSDGHGVMADVIHRLIECVSHYLHLFISIPIERIPDLLTVCAPCLCSYFRRVVSWCEFAGVSPVPGAAVGQSMFFVALVRLARKDRPEHLTYVQHEWLSKLSIACGPLGSRYIAANLHELFNFFSACYPSWVSKSGSKHAYAHECIVAVYEDITSLCQRLASSAPSPSLLLSCWEASLCVSNAFLAVARDPLLLEIRLSLVHQLVLSGALSVNTFHSQPSQESDDSLSMFMRQAATWDNLSEYRQSKISTSPSQLPAFNSTNEPQVSDLFLHILAYLIPAVESEKQFRRWNSFSSQLFEISQFLSDLNAPQFLLNMLVRAAVAVSKRLYGVDATALVAICNRFVTETFRRVSVETAWNLTGTIADESETVLESQFLEAEPPLPVVIPSVVEAQSFEVVKRKETVNLLHRIASAYKAA